MASNFNPTPKERGNVILAKDWNTAMTEIVRLGADSLTVSGGTISGDVIANGNFGIGTGTAAPTAKLEVNGDIKTNLAIINNGGYGADWAGFSHKDRGTQGNYALLQHKNGTTLLNASSSRNIRFRINNVDKMRLTSDGALNFGDTTRQMINLWNGNYGIGIQHSTQYYRTDKNFAWFKGGSHHNAELNPGTNGSAQMVLKDGKLGVGTSAPTANLEVNGDIKTDRAVINDVGFGANYAGFSHKDKGTQDDYALIHSNTGATYLNAASGQTIDFRINNREKMTLASNGALTFHQTAQQLLNLGTTNFGLGVQTSTQYFRTAKNFAWYKGGAHNLAELNPGTNGDIQMVLKDGNLGIGTDGPIQKLDVNGRMNVEQGVIQRGGTAITNTRDLGLYSGVSNSWLRLVTKSGRIAFYSDDGAGTTPNLTVEANGNVGIGTGLTVATEKLEVNGTIKAEKFAGDGSALTGLNALSNTGGTIKGNLTISGVLKVSDEISAAGFVGDGSKLTGIATSAASPWTSMEGGNGIRYTNGVAVTIGTLRENANLEVHGKVKAAQFEGDGSKLTGIALGSTSPWTDLPDAAGGKGIQYKSGKTVTIGAANSGANLHILNKNQEAGDGDSLVLGKTDGNAPSLRLGYHGDYTWLQSHNKPLAINPTGGNVGIGAKDPKGTLDVAGYILMHKPAVANAATLVKDLPNSSLIVAGPEGDSLLFYWKDENGKEYELKLQGTVQT